jgi:EmrB/QacA subfamily drug resistance transporter
VQTKPSVPASEGPASGQPAGGHRVYNQKLAVVVVYVAALFMNIMDTTIVNVALPTLGRQFHVGPAAVDIVVIAYLVSLAVFIPASGWIGDRFGAKRVLLVAIGIFTVASALCGAATSLDELVVFRVLQGVGGGMLIPVGMAMLYRTFPPSERVRVAGMLMLPTALAPALGPVLGGLLVTDLSWRWVFYVNLPVGVAALIYGCICMQERQEADPGRFDLTGFTLAAVGFAALMYGLSEGPSKGWGSAVILGPIVAGVVLITALVGVERRTAEPIIDIRLFGDRMFGIANLLVTMTMLSFFGVLYLVPLFYQDGRGLSALGSGLSTFPEAVGVFVSAQVVSRYLYPVVGPRRLMASGLVGIAVATALMALVGSHTSLWWMRLLMFALGYCIPNVMMSMQTAAFATVPSASTGRASTLFNAQRQLGGAIGVALLSTVVAAAGPFVVRAGHRVPHLVAYHDAFLTSSAVALLAAVVALTFVHDADAAATMVRRVRRSGPEPVSSAQPAVPPPAAR